jgi:glycosyltransferase involved in cell wall biosynthesis
MAPGGTGMFGSKKLIKRERLLNNPPKHIAIFLPALWGGGAERVMLDLGEALAEKGIIVDLVLAQAEGPCLAEIPASLRMVELNARHHTVLRTLASLPALVRYLRHERPDVLLAGLHANIVALWARRLAGFPQRVVITEHNTFSQQNRLLPAWYGRLMIQLVRRFYPWADGIVAVSQGAADDLAKIARIPRKRIQVIYNPIITPRLRAKVREFLEHSWFAPGEPPVLLAIGRLTAQKDFGTLIHAFARIRRTRLAKLLILGEGEKRVELEALVKQLNLEHDVSMPGFVPNPYPFISKASLFVLSSRWEGLPTVLVEALYCGPPIIATDCPSGPREILREGQYGRLVPVGDAASLAQSIEETLDDPGAPPPRESLQPFEVETAVKQYMSIL